MYVALQKRFLKAVLPVGEEFRVLFHCGCTIDTDTVVLAHNLIVRVNGTPRGCGWEECSLKDYTMILDEVGDGSQIDRSGSPDGAPSTGGSTN